MRKKKKNDEHARVLHEDNGTATATTNSEENRLEQRKINGNRVSVEGRGLETHCDESSSGV